MGELCPNARRQSACFIARDSIAPLDFAPSERARRVVKDYNPEEHAKLLKSRVARWEAACADAKDAIKELIGIQEEFSDWQANLPENFQEGALADKLGEVCDLNFDDALSAIEEAEQIDLPLGFGRD